MSDWYELSLLDLKRISPGKTDEAKLKAALDIKYGNFDYTRDLRILNSDELKAFFSSKVSAYTRKSKQYAPNILITGANSGAEVPYLTGHNITAVDLSQVALNKLNDKYPYIKTFNSNAAELPFIDKFFDIYISMRTLQSKDMDLNKALDESMRVVIDGGLLIYSIPNGYLRDGKVLKGMWDSNKNIIDTDLPYKVAKTITNHLEQHKISSSITETLSEIIILAENGK